MAEDYIDPYFVGIFIRKLLLLIQSTTNLVILLFLNIFFLFVFLGQYFNIFQYFGKMIGQFTLKFDSFSCITIFAKVF